MKRRKFSSKFKTKVVLEALSERYTLAELAERHKLHPNQISAWKLQFVSKAEMVFEKGVKDIPSIWITSGLDRTCFAILGDNSSSIPRITVRYGTGRLELGAASNELSFS